MKDGVHKTQMQAKVLRKNMPEAEQRLWYFIRKAQIEGFRFRKQHPVGPYIVDFACVKERLVIEVDGATHSTDKEQIYDARRTQYLENKGWKVVRYSNEEIYTEIEDVLNAIHAHLKQLK